MTILDFVSPVLTHLECQRLCQDSLGCLAWTFTTEFNSEVELGCILYSDIGRTTYQPHTISGPVSCVCSHQLACSASPDNEVEVSVGVMEVSVRVMEVNVGVMEVNVGVMEVRRPRTRLR